MNIRKWSFAAALMLFVISAALMTSGCGSGKQAQIDALSMENARMSYQMDSLMAENRRTAQQMDALASENRVLTARTADLEVRLREAKSPPPAPPPPPKAADMGSGYANALAVYNTRDFSRAMLMFEELLRDGVEQDLGDNCHYWIGECLYGMGKYSDAIHHFETVLGFASSEKKDDSMLMIGNSLMASGNREGAKDWYNKMITSFPASPYIPKAKEKLSGL